jgi:hypothetical protein
MVRVGRAAPKNEVVGVIRPARQIRSMAKFQPRKIQGRWRDGYSLYLHTLSSTPIGYNEYGHMQFDTKRSELGELLYRLKYGADKAAIAEIVDVRSANLRPPGILAQK